MPRRRPGFQLGVALATPSGPARWSAARWGLMTEHSKPGSSRARHRCRTSLPDRPSAPWSPPPRLGRPVRRAGPADHRPARLQRRALPGPVPRRAARADVHRLRADHLRQRLDRPHGARSAGVRRPRPSGSAISASRQHRGRRQPQRGGRAVPRAYFKWASHDDLYHPDLLPLRRGAQEATRTSCSRTRGPRVHRRARHPLRAAALPAGDGEHPAGIRAAPAACCTSRGATTSTASFRIDVMRRMRPQGTYLHMPTECWSRRPA